MKELLKRVIVAIIGIPLFVFSIFQGGAILFILVIIISTLALYEFYNLFDQLEIYPHKVTGLVFNVLLISTFFVCKPSDPIAFQYLFLELVLFSLLIVGSELWSKNHKPLYNTTSTIAGVIYISLSFVSFLALRNIFNTSYCDSSIHCSNQAFFNNFGVNFSNSDNYSAWILMITLISIWVCDTFAYFFGKSFGKHKIYPKISPKKSWEGSIAGFVGAILAFAILVHFLIPGFPIYHAIILGALSGSIGQIGDLAESQFKREAGVKDSSNILPGHGGIFDRFDSIIFVVPVVYIYLSIIKVLN